MNSTIIFILGIIYILSAVELIGAEILMRIKHDDYAPNTSRVISELIVMPLTPILAIGNIIMCQERYTNDFYRSVDWSHDQARFESLFCFLYYNNKTYTEFNNL